MNKRLREDMSENTTDDNVDYDIDFHRRCGIITNDESPTKELVCSPPTRNDTVFTG